MIPAPYTLSVKPFDPSATDDYGNAVDAWGSSRSWAVHAVAPGAMEEPGQTNRDLSVVAFTVYAPSSADLPGVRDLVTLEGVDYAVNGTPMDWTRGPWANPAAGVVVELRRVEG